MINSHRKIKNHLDMVAVGARFFSCYPKMPWSEAARFFKEDQSYIVSWKTRGFIPWKWLKILSDSQGISWDWLLEEYGDKYSGKPAKSIRNRNPKFPKTQINRRFFSLFDNAPQIEIAQTLGVAPSTVNGWNVGRIQVPWHWLKYAVDTFGVRWDWLIDGLSPIYRNNIDGEVKENPFKFSISENETTLNKLAIGERFFLCYPDLSKLAIAKFFKASQPFVVKWHTRGLVPWAKLKYLSDSQAISWDWLLEGIEPKDSAKKARTPRSLNPKFPVARINARFFSLFPQTKQITIADMLDVSSGTVNNWKQNRAQVPWRRLAAAVHAFGLRWDWLIDGISPKRRE